MALRLLLSLTSAAGEGAIQEIRGRELLAECCVGMLDTLTLSLRRWRLTSELTRHDRHANDDLQLELNEDVKGRSTRRCVMDEGD